MPLIINAGSRIDPPGLDSSWTNTYPAARAEAERWLVRMHGEGMTDVVLLDDVTKAGERWVFTYKHQVTGTTVTLKTHGISDLDAYHRDFVFPPRIYWNGSSSDNPKLEDFAAPGFKVIRTYAAG